MICWFLLLLFNISPTISSKIEGFGIVGVKPGSSRYPFFVIVDVHGRTCGGTLVASNAVVTAANCLYVQDKNRWAFSEEIIVLKSDFANPDWEERLLWYIVESYSYHESYNPTIEYDWQPNNIALIKLYDCIDITRPRNGILQICPPTMESWKASVIGMGLTNKDSHFSSEVLTDRTLYKTSPCRKYLDGQELDFDERKQVCYKSRSKTRYNGLSGVAPGSPLVHKSVFSSKPICLIGIANTANDSTSSSQDPSLFTRIEYYRQWISQTYEELSRLGSKCTIL